MSGLVYYVAASLDGFIATHQHALDWLNNFTLGDDATPYDDFYQTVGAVIMGGTTYCWIIENFRGEWPYKNVPVFVLTRQFLPTPQELNIATVSGSATDIATLAKSVAADKKVWVVGGGKTAAFFADAGELSQLQITTIPVFLGSGIPVLPADRLIYVKPVSHRILKSGATEIVLQIPGE
ncbi:dihydrofolate reductase family protein (plasmid) [Klebsiella sp. WOUb02]|uniref:dihydrofolate reductase family protein n=1 Tax=Klebsiella sp. WOUb02 TaxID=3161071 RepID=UPI003CE9C024